MWPVYDYGIKSNIITNMCTSVVCTGEWRINKNSIVALVSYRTLNEPFYAVYGILTILFREDDKFYNYIHSPFLAIFGQTVDVYNAQQVGMLQNASWL